MTFAYLRSARQLAQERVWALKGAGAVHQISERPLLHLESYQDVRVQSPHSLHKGIQECILTLICFHLQPWYIILRSE